MTEAMNISVCGSKTAEMHVSPPMSIDLCKTNICLFVYL